MSLLVASHLRGLIYSAFPAGVFVLPSNQQLVAPALNETYVHHHNKKSERG